MQTENLYPCSPIQWSFNMAPILHLTFLLPLFCPASLPSPGSHLQVQIFAWSEIPSCCSSASYLAPRFPMLAGHQERKEWELALYQGLTLAAECSNAPWVWRSCSDPRGNIALWKSLNSLIMWKTCSEKVKENGLFSPSKAAELYQNPCQLSAALIKSKLPNFFYDAESFLGDRKSKTTQLKCVSSLHADVHERD